MQNRALLVAAQQRLGYIGRCPTTSNNSKPTCWKRPCATNRRFAPVPPSLRTKRRWLSCGPNISAMRKSRNSSPRGSVTYRRRRSAGFAGSMFPEPMSAASALVFIRRHPSPPDLKFHLQPVRLSRLFPIHAVPKLLGMITEGNPNPDQPGQANCPSNQPDSDWPTPCNARQ